jgi:predicted DNA-binding ribbon-helix-helix protein
MTSRTSRHLIPRCFTDIDSAVTTVAIEAVFWEAFDEILDTEKKSLASLLREINRQRMGPGGDNHKHSGISLASAVRTYILIYWHECVKVLLEAANVASYEPPPFPEFATLSGSKVQDAPRANQAQILRFTRSPGSHRRS